ncbi:cilia-and flagella-associated protein 96 [Nomia melanderi]|uniref:cilia-and flagella-associated protein 96 n=1 Tax=Nomia melanderi TaxID=2448451 RepID=UPI003FCD2B57
MKRSRVGPEPFGKRFGKTDLDRVGFFHDPSPAPFDTYEGTGVKFREGIEKGRQLHPGPPTPLFEEKFLRIFDGEALNEPWPLEAKERLDREKTYIGGRLLPPSPAKKHATSGDYYGCFNKISYFNPAVREGKPREPELPNVKIKPNPRGGPGYVDISLSRYPSYSHNPYDPEIKRKGDKRMVDTTDNIAKQKGKSIGRFLYASAPLDFFPPNPHGDEIPGSTYIRPKEVKVKIIPPGRIYVPFPKKPGGNHSGCFEKFPSYSSDPYIKDTPKIKKKEGVFVLNAPPERSKYTKSIISHVTAISCNATNYDTYQARVYPLRK